MFSYSKLLTFKVPQRNLSFSHSLTVPRTYTLVLCFSLQTLNKKSIPTDLEPMSKSSSPTEMLLSLILSCVFAYKFVFWLLETCSRQVHVCAQTSQWVSRNEIGLKKSSQRERLTVLVYFWLTFSLILESELWLSNLLAWIPTGSRNLPRSVSFLPAPHLGVFWLTQLTSAYLFAFSNWRKECGHSSAETGLCICP